MTQPPPPRHVATLRCKQCGGSMLPRTISSGNCLGIAIALIVLGLGLWLTFFVPFGLLVGMPVAFCALFIGGVRRNVWKCSACGCVLERSRVSTADWGLRLGIVLPSVILAMLAIDSCRH